MKDILKIFIFSIIVFIIINVLYIYYSFSFLIKEEKYFIYTVIIIGILIIIGSFVLKKKKVLKYSISFFIVAIITLFSGDFIKQQQLNKTKNNAIEVIGLLSNYKKENGNYPNEINETQLKSQIPKYTIGIRPKEFVYENLGNYYLLTYNSFKYTETYNSKTNEWYLED